MCVTFEQEKMEEAVHCEVLNLINQTGIYDRLVWWKLHFISWYT